MPGNIFQSSVYPFWGLDSIVMGFPSWAFCRERGIGETFPPSRDASVHGEPRLVCAGCLPVRQSMSSGLSTGYQNQEAECGLMA